MRLIDYIYAGKVDYDVRRDIGVDAHDPYCVDCNNVHRWVREKRFAGPPAVCPRAKLPFDFMWFEYRPGDDTDYTYGCFAAALRPSADRPENLISLWVYTRGDDEESARFQGFIHADVSSDGALAGVRWEQYPSFHRMVISEIAALKNSIPIWASIAFFHCKNVIFREVHSSRQVRRRVERFGGLPPRSFAFIEVHKNARQAQLEKSRGAAASRAYRAHIVRGNFADYKGEGHKFMGKHECLVFRPAHVRGDGDSLHTAKRDYRVWGPEKGHERRCLVKPRRKL